MSDIPLSEEQTREIHLPETKKKKIANTRNIQACLTLKLLLNNGTFTLPDTETDTDIDKLAQNPVWIYVGVCLWALWTPRKNSIQAIFVGLGVGQYEDTLSSEIDVTWKSARIDITNEIF